MLQPLPMTEELYRAIDERRGDGVAVFPYQAIECPICHKPAAVIHVYLGGYGKHCAWRCLSDRDHQGPLIRDFVAEQWMLGHYERIKLCYEIIPVVKQYRTKENC